MAESAETLLNTGLKTLLGHLYVMYFRAHSAHWNVEGKEFVSLHEFFSGVYTDVFGSIDTFAEAIRQHKAFAPVDLAQLLKYGAGQGDADLGGNAQNLLKELDVLNNKLQAHLAHTRKLAEAAGDFGLANFTQDREAAHLKLSWMLRALID